MRTIGKCLKLFNSLGVISVLILIAMVLTTVTGSASVERDPQFLTQSLVQSHLVDPAGMKNRQ
ncbi:MAG: hypothetical protein KJO10_01265 [Gammaproteobacteria bacterium]|nr:hypothetical protein [Gammaproteobacteria bacterium]